jgi:hypothetical protein
MAPALLIRQCTGRPLSRNRSAKDLMDARLDMSTT